MTCAALLVFRWRKSAPPAMFKATGGVFAALAALVLAGWLLSNSSWLDARDSAIAATIGLLIYVAYRLTRTDEVRKTSAQDER
jgi:peptidoglycan/LPS O-acetylase OafA/YrhL